MLTIKNSYILVFEKRKKAKHILKILLCGHRKVFKVYLAISHRFAWKG